MGSHRPWTDEEEDLLEQAIDEAVTCVLSQFETLIEGLEPESRALIRDFYDGKPVEELGRSRGLTRKQVEDWLARTRRQLANSLRTSRPVKQ